MEKMKRKTILPDLGHLILRDIFIGSDERHLLGKGGCDKQAVEGVAVYQGKGFKGGKVSGFNGDNCNVVCFSKIHKLRHLAGKIQLSYVYFYSKFPCGNNAQIYGVGKIANNGIRCFRQSGIVIKKPYPSNKRIRQINHCNRQN
jgi:hypothetical protein